LVLQCAVFDGPRSRPSSARRSRFRDAADQASAPGAIGSPPRRRFRIDAASLEIGEERVSCVPGRQTSRQAKAGQWNRGAPRRCSYTPPTESRSVRPTVRSSAVLTARRGARLAICGVANCRRSRLALVISRAWRLDSCDALRSAFCGKPDAGVAASGLGVVRRLGSYDPGNRVPPVMWRIFWTCPCRATRSPRARCARS